MWSIRPAFAPDRVESEGHGVQGRKAKTPDDASHIRAGVTNNLPLLTFLCGVFYNKTLIYHNFNYHINGISLYLVV
jgi:hypothetical protein